MNKLLTLIIIAVLSLAINLQAEDGHAIHHNHIGVFIGPTTNTHYEHTDFSLGIDYEFRINQMFGVGLFAERVFADHAENLFGMLAFVHPWHGFKFVVGGGLAMVPVAVVPENEDNGHSKIDVIQSSDADVETENENMMFFRGGVAYDFHTRFVTLTPTFNVDVIDGHVSLVYGLAIGIGF